MSKGFTLWFTGLSGAGKTTLARLIGPEIERRGLVVDSFDGDAVRERLSKGLGFSKEERRDSKGLYAKALVGEITNFTGVSAPYEEPIDPELRLDTVGVRPEQSATAVVALLERRGLISAL